MSNNEPLIPGDNEALNFGDARIRRSNTLSVVNLREFGEASLRTQNRELVNKITKKTVWYGLAIAWLTLCLSLPRIFGGSLVPECKE